MKNPRLVPPQSFFSRTLWLVLIVVLFSKALTLVYLLMNEDVLVDRQYSHGVALTLRAYWAADETNRAKNCRGGDADPRCRCRRAGGRAALALQRDLSTPDAGRTGCRYRGAITHALAAGAVGTSPEPGGMAG
nr:hypothetical protein GCM10020185_28540 [Pseudomonas brassicacearum subsp. brassicacearum]